MKKGAMESWYLLGAWLLAATMNAVLTWWAISAALLKHDALGNEIADRETLLSSVPVFVATLVWLIRVLMIGSFTLAGTKLLGNKEIDFDEEDEHRQQPINGRGMGKHQGTDKRRFKPAPKPARQR